jgi:O-succinylbenzoate synthase
MTWPFAYRRYRLPFKLPVRTGRGAWPEREGLFVRLERPDGTKGYGEAATLPWFGTESADEAEAACKSFGDTLDEALISSLPETLPCLRNALCAALARPSLLPPPSSHLFVAALLPAGRAALAVAGPKVEAGFRVFKWKVGVDDLSLELGLLDELCSVLPEGSKLRLDANGAWDRRRAERWLERCAERPVEFVEQPTYAPPGEALLKADDLLLGLARDFPTPLALDESLVSGRDVERWLGLGWPGVYIVKPSLFGNPAGVLDRLAGAEAPVVFSSAFETAVGARTALEAAFAWRGEARALGFGVWPLFADARFDGPAAAPFLGWTDVSRIDPEAAWNALN